MHGHAHPPSAAQRLETFLGGKGSAVWLEARDTDQREWDALLVKRHWCAREAVGAPTSRFCLFASSEERCFQGH